MSDRNCMQKKMDIISNTMRDAAEMYKDKAKRELEEPGNTISDVFTAAAEAIKKVADKCGSCKHSTGEGDVLSAAIDKMMEDIFDRSSGNPIDRPGPSLDVNPHEFRPDPDTDD
jgi:hypothetical protein